MFWSQITEREYEERLDMMPPVIQRPWGFLIGETWYYNEREQPVFAAYVEYKQFGFGERKYAVSLEGLTVSEFLKLNMRDVEYDLLYDDACKYYDTLESLHE